MKNFKLIGGLLLAFVLCVVSGSWGDQPGIGPRPKCGFGPGAGGGPMLGGHFCMKKIIDELDLTAAQKKKVDGILAKNEEQSKKQIESLEKARKQLSAASSADKFDEAAFRKAFKQESAAKEELMVAKKKMAAEIHAVLTPEQAAYLKGYMKGIGHENHRFQGKGFRRPPWQGEHNPPPNPEAFDPHRAQEQSK